MLWDPDRHPQAGLALLGQTNDPTDLQVLKKGDWQRVGHHERLESADRQYTQVGKPTDEAPE